MLRAPAARVAAGCLEVGDAHERNSAASRQAVPTLLGKPTRTRQRHPFAIHIVQYLTSDSPCAPECKVDTQRRRHLVEKISNLVPPQQVNIVFWRKGSGTKTEVKFCIVLFTLDKNGDFPSHRRQRKPPLSSRQARHEHPVHWGQRRRLDCAPFAVEHQAF